jgi:predicted O-methyltransferase YrrM
MRYFLRNPREFGLMVGITTNFLRKRGILFRSRREKVGPQSQSLFWQDYPTVPLQEWLKNFDHGCNKSSLAMPNFDIYKAENQKRLDILSYQMGGAGSMELLYTLCINQRVRTVAESGVAAGWSSLAILMALEELGRGTLWSNDRPYIGLGSRRDIGLVVPPELKKNWKLMIGSDHRNLKRMLRRASPIDLFHYDSDKSYEGRTWAYPLIWESLKQGGWLISDDVQDNSAFLDYFVDKLGLEPTVIDFENKKIGVVQKN